MQEIVVMNSGTRISPARHLRVPNFSITSSIALQSPSSSSSGMVATRSVSASHWMSPGLVGGDCATAGGCPITALFGATSPPRRALDLARPRRIAGTFFGLADTGAFLVAFLGIAMFDSGRDIVSAATLSYQTSSALRISFDPGLRLDAKPHRGAYRITPSGSGQGVATVEKDVLPDMYVSRAARVSLWPLVSASPAPEFPVLITA